jgi:hypothetical protein
VTGVGDLNGDGAVDFQDLQVLELSFGATAPGPYQPFGALAAGADEVGALASATVAPEPGTVGMVGVGLAVAVAGRRRRRR